MQIVSYLNIIMYLKQVNLHVEATSLAWNELWVTLSQDIKGRVAWAAYALPKAQAWER